MDDARRDWLGRILERAAALAPDERARFLEEASGGDEALRAELASLVDAFQSSAGWFEDLAERVIAPVLTGLHTLPDDDEAGRVLGHYEVVERIGRGGMGVVYRARDRRLGRFVALKFLPPQLADDDTARARLVAEARAASALDHPNIGVIHEIGEDAGRGAYIAMAWYDGETLADRLREGPLDVAEAIRLVSQIAGALAAAHAAGIVHRDIKPSNILCTTRGVAKLLDFGIARTAVSTLTREGTTVGTVAYMSPEQTRGHVVDARSDLWSLGVLFYEMLAGQRPFRGDTEEAVIFAIRHDEPQRVAELRPEVGPALASLVATCLARDPELRFQRAEELLAALHALDTATAHDGPAHGTARIRRAGRGRGPARFAAAAAAVLLLGITAYVVGSRPGNDGLDPRRVVVAPFENHTGRAALDPVGSMAADWIIHGLSLTGAVQVVPVTAALGAAAFAGRAPGSGQAAEGIRTVAMETGAGIVVSGAYYEQSDSLLLRATVTDARLGRVLHSLEPVAAPIDLPLAAIEQLRQQLMSVLAARLNPRMRTFAQTPGFGPPSFEAYRAHAQGLELFIARDWRGAIGRFAEAAAQDSGFLMPLLFAALSHVNLGNLAAVDSIIRTAGPRAGRLSEADRAGFEFLEALVRGDRPAAYRAQLRNPELAPGSLAHWGLANAALWVNRPREAITISRQLDPERGELRGWFLYWRDLARAHHMLGEHREELRVVRRARALFPDDPQAVVLEIRALAALRRHSELMDLLAVAGPDRPALLRLAGIELLAHGSPERGTVLLRESLQHHLAGGRDTPAALSFRAAAHYLLGEWDSAEPLLRELAAVLPDDVELQGRLGTLAAATGSREEVARISAWLSAYDRPYADGRHTYWRARIAALLGEREEAVRLLGQAVGEGFSSWDELHREPDLAPLREHPPFREFVRPRG